MENPRSEEEKMNIFEYEKEEETYYKPVRVNNFWSNNYIKYRSNGDKEY